MAAPRASDNPTTQHHYAAQLALLLALRKALASLWPSLDLRNLKESEPTYATKVAALVTHYAQANIAISAEFYAATRSDSGVASRFTTPLIDAPTMQAIEDAVRGGLDPLWTSPNLGGTTFDTPEARQAAIDKQLADAESAAQARVDENVEKIAADAGRNELISAIQADKYARGYARVTREGACSFCTLLATRGAVYKTAESAGKGEPYHVNCRCTIVPLFADHYEPPAHIREAQRLYDESTKNVSGSRAKQKAFRRAFEHRANGREHS